MMSIISAPLAPRILGKPMQIFIMSVENYYPPLKPTLYDKNTNPLPKG